MRFPSTLEYTKISKHTHREIVVGTSQSQESFGTALALNSYQIVLKLVEEVKPMVDVQVAPLERTLIVLVLVVVLVPDENH